MEEKLGQLQSKLETDKEFAEKLFSLETAEEVQSLLGEQGIEFTLEEIGALREALVKATAKGAAGELSDEELEEVAGGGSGGGVHTQGGSLGDLFNNLNLINMASKIW